MEWEESWKFLGLLDGQDGQQDGMSIFSVLDADVPLNVDHISFTYTPYLRCSAKNGALLSFIS
jgi:hypothetical protein